MKSLLAFLIFLLPAACGIQLERPPVERQSFLIQPERISDSTAPTWKRGALRIGNFHVAPPFDGRAFIYRRDDVRFETDFYNEFATDPATMLTAATTAWLGRSGLFRHLSPVSATATADYRLEAYVGAFYVDFRSPAPAVQVTIRWRLMRETDRVGVLEVDCRRQVALPEKSAAGAARAYRVAVEQALQELEAALAAASL